MLHVLQVLHTFKNCKIPKIPKSCIFQTCTKYKKFMI